VRKSDWASIYARNLSHGLRKSVGAKITQPERPSPTPEQKSLHVTASLSHEGRGESECCINTGKQARGIPSPLVGEGKHSSPR